MKVKDCVGKEAIHKDYGRVLVTSAPPKSKTTVNIKVIQRGPGWNEVTETYRRYKLPTVVDPITGNPSLRWGFTNRDEYGIEDQCHIKDLKLCE